jgi:hypothetical protein
LEDYENKFIVACCMSVFGNPVLRLQNNRGNAETSMQDTTAQMSDGHDVAQEDPVVGMLRDFYASYLAEQVKAISDYDYRKVDSLKLHHVTKRFLNELIYKELEYDVFTGAQDYEMDWLKTLKIEKDMSKTNIYNLSFAYDRFLS